MMENLIRLSLGQTIDIEPKFHRWSCVQFLNEENYYRCQKFISSGDPHIRRSEIREYRDSVIKSSLDRLGYVIMQADTKGEIDSLIDDLKK